MDKSRRVTEVLLAACVAGASCRMLTDPDLPWHMAVGRELFEGRWPGKDTFSYTHAGTWVPYEYLADAMLAISPQAVGALAIGTLAFFLYKRAGAARAALALAAMGPFLIVRPALLGFACFAAACAASDRAAIGLQALWANLHGFAVVGAAAAWLKRSWRTALAATAATTLCAFGPAIFLGPWKIAGHSGLIAEWAPSSFELFTLYNPALGLFTLAVLWPARRDTLVLALFAATLLRYRMAPLFIIAAAPYMRLPRMLPGAAVAALALLLLLARKEAPFGKGWDPSRLPINAVEWIAAKKPWGPVYNDLAFGGWLIWRLRQPVFVDGRTAWLYRPDFLESIRVSENDPAKFRALQNLWGFHWALIDARPGTVKGYALSASERWTMVYCDDLAAVYVLKGQPLAEEGYKVLRHLSPWQLMRESGADAKTLAADAALAARQAPGSRRSILWRAGAALAAGDGEELERAIKALESRYPGDPELPALERALVIR